jgi:hypothetical protein
MDQAKLNEEMPIVPHGGECCGCIFAIIEGNKVNLMCNECEAVVGTIETKILVGLRGLDSVLVECPYCGAGHIAAGFTELYAYICRSCGAAVELKGAQKKTERPM